MKPPLQILMAEDNPADVRLLARALNQAGFEFCHQVVHTEEDYLRCLHSDLDIILSDYEMPQFSGLRALELLNERELEIPFILISGTIGEDLAVEAMKLGATDYLLKDRLARFGPAVAQAVEQGRMRREKRRTEDALRESEERFRQLAENIQDVFWLTDIEKNQMLYVSPAYEKIWGRSRAELYQSPRSWIEAIHPDDRGGILRAAVSKQTGGTYDEEYRIVRPDGAVRWIRDRAFPVVDSAGATVRIVGVARDITEGKETEEALRESERRFREMLENVEMIAMTLDLQGRVTFCNDYFLKLTKWTREEVIGADWFGKFIAGSELKESFFSSVKSGKLPAHYENPVRARDGEVRDIVWNNTMLRDANGDFTGTASLGEDVTERKRAEERVREQAAMLDRTQDAIIVRGFQDRKIAFWSRGAEALYGWTVAEASGRNIGELIHADPTAPDRIEQALLRCEEWRGEIHHRTKNGAKLIVDTRATLLRGKDGTPKGVLLTNTDMTERKELELRFLRAQRMESIGTLASGVAHDLNNILAPIMMSAPILRRELSTEKRVEIVTTIEMAASRGAQIIKQVLTFGRGLEGERTPLQITVLIKEIMKIMRETFPRNITLSNFSGAELWPVLGDATQLHQVLLNLCVNARDALPDGGELQIGARNLDLDASYASMLADAKPGPHVLLEVSDTGMGMPPEVVERIFEPFFTTKGIGKGTGLGLSTVLGIVRSHGGFIQVQSQSGRGTKFQVYLPATPSLESDAIEVPGEPIPDGHGEIVLVVDDEESVRDSIRIALETAGYRVLVAADGIEALGHYGMNAPRIAVVLTDLMMPSMDGLTLIRALRAIAPAVPIVASTGLGEKANIAQLTAAGIGTVLHKPFGAETLLRAVHNVLQPASARPAIT